MEYLNRYYSIYLWNQIVNPDLQVNLLNKFGLSALHTACRFNVPGAIFDLLKHRDIDTNLRSSHGSTAVMVAVKYCSKEALEIIIRFVVTTSCCETKYF